jgi:GDP-L-fucose synthase
MCEYYRRQYGRLYHSAMPTNLYGPGDNYHPSHSHVMPALIRRFEEARLTNAPSVTLWGTGTPLREFLHVEDLARGLLFLLEQENPPDWVNVGSGQEVSIRQLAELVKEATEFEGELVFDTNMPDGTPRKFCDTTRIRNLGWRPTISLAHGIKRTVGEYRTALASGTLRH